ncbi:MAG TPA: K(+)-transporting ATPase subunit F [Gaiellaceae bacterium]|jgi:K+-transporting ATPase KdpF subunit
MTAEDIVGLVLAVIVLGYLVYALIAPEKLG